MYLRYHSACVCVCVRACACVCMRENIYMYASMCPCLDQHPHQQLPASLDSASSPTEERETQRKRDIEKEREMERRKEIWGTHYPDFRLYTS